MKQQQVTCLFFLWSAVMMHLIQTNSTQEHRTVWGFRNRPNSPTQAVQRVVCPAPALNGCVCTAHLLACRSPLHLPP
jgi:hypothetical protein